VSTAPLDRLGPWTHDDLLTIDDEVHRFEVVDGSLVVSPPPPAFHQRVARRLFVQLHAQVPAEWQAVYPSTSVSAPTGGSPTSP
jgi:Uma2 family endonuclease